MLSPSAHEHILSQTRSQYIKAKVNATHHMKKAKEVSYALKKGQSVLAIKKQDVAEGQQEIAELDRTWKNYEEQAQQQGASHRRDIELEEDQVSVCQTTPFPFSAKSVTRFNSSN